MRCTALLTLLVGCWIDEERLTAAQDRDGDGHLATVLGGDDCDDDDPAIRPGALELCGDGVDNDCDGVVDDNGVGELIFYADVDGDGFGREVTAIGACDAPVDHVQAIGDCDDDDPTVHPDADDLCNERDDDCDGRVDEDAPPVVLFRDADGDLRGTIDEQLVTCDRDVEGYVRIEGDCDDSSPLVYVGAPDGDCDGIDDDCDGDIDEHATFTTWLPDADGDGWGLTDGLPVTSCASVPGHADRGGDCDDGNPEVSPDQQDGDCDGIDDDCDGVVDEGSVFLDYLPDADGDGWGDVDGLPTTSCLPLPGRVTRGGDCDDGAASVNGGANDDNCDGIDNDCNGAADDGATFVSYYADDDLDGWGRTDDVVVSCVVLPDRVTNGGDCNDTDPVLNPGVPEVCDGVDNDCSGVADDGLPVTLYHDDLDADGFGDPTTGVVTCATGDGRVLDATDCDDADAFVNPAAIDLCDGVDTDCNGSIDDDAVFTLYFPDADDDGLGDTLAPFQSCGVELGAVLVPGDCDDTDPMVTGRRWYPDGDGDGFGGTPVAEVCEAPSGHVEEGGDCEDQSVDAFPGAAEICGDGLDNGCDHRDDCAWSGTLFPGDADLVLTLQPGDQAMGVIDANLDGVGDIWIARAASTEIYYGGAVTPSLVGPGDWSLPADCQPFAVPDLDDDDWPELACSPPGAFLLYLAVGQPPSVTYTAADPTFGSRHASSWSPRGLWLGSSTELYFFHSLAGTQTPADATTVTRRSGDLATLARVDDDDAVLLVDGNGDLLAWSSAEIVDGPPDRTFPTSPSEVFTLEARLAPQGLPSSYLVTANRFTLAPSVTTRSWALSTSTLSDLDDDAVSIFVGRPNEPVEGFAVPSLDRDDMAAGWVVTTGSAQFPRAGVIREIGEATLADVEAFFVDGLDRPLRFQTAIDQNADGAPDLVFHDEDDRLLIFHRTLE